MNWCSVRRELLLLDADDWRVYAAVNFKSWLLGLRFGGSEFDAWVVVEIGPLSLVTTHYLDETFSQIDGH